MDSNTTGYIVVPITIPYVEGDELEHQPPYYFCNAPACPCHIDPELTAMLAAMVDAKEVSAARALMIYWNML